MKHKILFPLAALGMFVVTAVSCDKVTEKIADGGDAAAELYTEVSESCSAKNEISFKTITAGSVYTLLESAEDFDRNVDVVLTDTISMVVPTEVMGKDISGLNDAIFNMAFESVADTPEQTVKQNLGHIASQSGYESVRIEKSAINKDALIGLSETRGDVFMLTPSFLVYRVSIANMMPGAAHGSYSHRYVTYSMSENKVLTLRDIFTSSGLKELPKIIAKKAKNMKKMIGKTDISELPSNGNFYVGIDGEIVFVYQPYEVASFAQGVISIPFYPYELKEQFSKLGRRLFFND